jgi:hypothetical protein
VKKELEGYLDCGLLCRGFARLRCDACSETRLVSFSCKGRGFCPSCLGRRMSATAANLVDYVVPRVPLRQWVLTVPFSWRKRLGFNGPLLGAVVRKFSDAVLAFYKRRLQTVHASGPWCIECIEWRSPTRLERRRGTRRASCSVSARSWSRSRRS